MRKLFVLVIVAIMMVLTVNANAQSYKMVNGKVVESKKDTTAKAKKVADPVYQIVDGVTFYKGDKGGVYCWKTSKKTGKQYKSYVSTK
jgi:hypothetical protein